MLSFITAMNLAADASIAGGGNRGFGYAPMARFVNRSARAARSKYSPHQSEREQQRRRMQSVDVVVLEATASGNVKPRVMNAWLARNKGEAFPVAALLEFGRNLEEAAGLAEYDKVAQPEEVAQ
jgi:hypothetical protein